VEVPVEQPAALEVVEPREEAARERRARQAEGVVEQGEEERESPDQESSGGTDELVAVRPRCRDHITSRRYRNWYPKSRGQTRVAARSPRAAPVASRSRNGEERTHVVYN